MSNSTISNAPQATAEESEFKPITSQEELDKIIGERLGRERSKHAKDIERFSDYDDLQAKVVESSTQTQTLEEQISLLTKRIEESEAREQEAQARALRAEISASKGVPVDLLPTSGTKEDLEKAAEALLAWHGQSPSGQGLGPGASPTGGNGTGAPKISGVSAGRDRFRANRTKKTD